MNVREWWSQFFVPEKFDDQIPAPGVEGDEAEAILEEQFAGADDGTWKNDQNCEIEAEVIQVDLDDIRAAWKKPLDWS